MTKEQKSVPIKTCSCFIQSLQEHFLFINTLEINGGKRIKRIDLL